MAQFVVKNRRLKISPGGIISLPVSARKSLQMTRGSGTQVAIAVEGNSVSLRPCVLTAGFRVSPRGQMELRGEAREILENGDKRHFWMELNDETQTVTLHPWT